MINTMCMIKVCSLLSQRCQRCTSRVRMWLVRCMEVRMSSWIRSRRQRGLNPTRHLPVHRRGLAPETGRWNLIGKQRRLIRLVWIGS
ncbi:unnamed protein product [Linum tenue]|uniref:Secreted protein n=1 Tax=Linum tenue TaxID=586396 RepID=A0AAV0NNB9_9ROSI|nr:unnamed protein product [Linum tenue]